MRFDIFFSISHVPVDGQLPSEKKMWENFFSQVELADQLKFQTAWVAESHLSSQSQKKNRKPVVPHWPGEIGLNNDIFQLGHQVFAKTKKIGLGSAVLNLLSMGGPIATAERCASFLSFHPQRNLNIGFSGGRFDFMNRSYGIAPRNALEEVHWRHIRNQAFAEAAEIFLRLINKEEITSEQIKTRILKQENFQSLEEWQAFQKDFDVETEISLPKFYRFEHIKIVPQDFDDSHLDLILGSHDPNLQIELNQHRPVKVFNLSITKKEVIEATHLRMSEFFHKDGGKWQREYMPQTRFVFLDTKSSVAKERAKKALEQYWTAMEGTLDPRRIEQATENALVGNPEEIIQQIRDTFHPNDALMLWFDFFNHNSEEVESSMKLFAEKIAPEFQ